MAKRVTKKEQRLLDKIEEYKEATGKSQEVVNEEIAELELEEWAIEGIISALSFRIWRWQNGQCK